MRIAASVRARDLREHLFDGLYAMDGGRQGRPLRLLGFAALGLLRVLLRPSLLNPALAGAAGARPRSRPADGALDRIARRLPRWTGVGATAAFLLASVIAGAIRGGHIAEVTAQLADWRDAAANAAGFRITSVAVVGRKQLSQDEVLAIGGVTGRSSLLFIDAAIVRSRLKENPWIADATVLKLYPDRLQIEITERRPYALLQESGSLSVIAEDGAVLEPFVARRFASLPLVVGKGAGPKAKPFLDSLAQYPSLRKSVKAIVYVGERRWNLRLADGLDVRLPETGLDAALAMLNRLDQDEHLFSRDITAIDLRLSDRLTVTLSDEAAKARADSLPKPKRKANDA